MPAPITVLFMELTGEIYGGGQRSLLDVMTHLPPERFRAVLVCGSDGTLVRAARAAGLATHVVPMPSFRHEWRSVRQARGRLHAILREERVGLVHANVIRAALYALPVTRAAQIPLIFNVRVTDCPRPWDRWLDRWVAHRAQLIVANSEAVAARFGWLRGTPRLRVVHTGLDLRAYPTPTDATWLRQRLGLTPAARLLGIVALLEPRKGHAVLWQALPQILSRYPQAQVVAAGREPIGHRGYQHELTAMLVQQGLSSHVTFAGFLDDIPQALGGVEVCVLPVIQPEGFPRALLEAAALERAIVATPLGGVREIIEHDVTGLLVPPNDPERLAEAVLRLLDDPALAQRLGRAARERVAARFTLAAMMQRWQEIYELVMARE